MANGQIRVGFLVMIVPLYQAELCHPSIRGRVTTLQQFMLGVGALIASAVSYGAFTGYPDSDSRQWRVSLGIQLIPAGLLALLIMIFPESPRWLIDNGQNEKGLSTLAKLHAHGNEDDPWVRAEYDQIHEAIAFEHELEAKSYKELFVNRSSFRRLLIAVALQASVQMTGVSAIQYYSVTIFKLMGINAVNTLRLQIYNSLIALFAQLCCMIFIDRFGRRWPLILGNLANMLTFIIATILMAAFEPDKNRNEQAAWAFVAMTFLFNFSFSATCGPLSWIIPGKRSRAQSLKCSTLI